MTAGGSGPSAAAGLVQEAARVAPVDPEAAMALLSMVLTPRLRREDPVTSGRAHYLRAELLCDRGRYQDALGSVRSAHHDMLLGGRPVLALRTQVGRASILRELGDHRRSLELSERLLDQLKTADPSTSDASEIPITRALTQFNIALSLHALGRHDEAIRRLDLVWNSFRSLGDEAMLARVVRDRARAYFAIGLVHRALDDLETARRELQRLERLLAAAQCAVPIAECLIQLGRGAEAVLVLEDARPILEQRRALPELARVGLTMSAALLHHRFARAARDEASAAADLLMDLERIDDSARALVLAGIADLVTGDLDRARLDLEVAERMIGRLEAPSDRSLVRLAQATLHLRAGEIEQAQERARLVMDTGLTSAADGEAAWRAAALLVRSFDPDLAEAERALAEAAALILDQGYEVLDLAFANASASLAARRGDLVGAAAQWRTALMRDRVSASSEHAVLLPFVNLLSRAGAYDGLVATLVTIGSPRALTEAWGWAHASRELDPDDAATALRRAAARRRRGDLAVEPEYLTVSRLLDRERAAAAGGTSRGTRDPGALADAQLEMRRLLRARLSAATRAGAGTGGGEQRPELARPPEGPLLQLHVVQGDVIAFVVREGQVYARILAGAAETSLRLLADWRTECSRLAYLGAPPTDGRASPALAGLASLLVEPVADLLVDLEGMRLVVSTHRHLADVPFEALDLAGRPLAGWFDLRFVADVGEQAQRRTLAAPEDVLVLAVPDETAPAIAAEAAAVVKAHGAGTLLVGPDASTTAWGALLRQGRVPDVLHLACHGVFSVDHPSCSALRLGDRWVFAGEIAQLRLDGAVVVLNACSTGRGGGGDGGVGGLVWAFLAAGAHGAVATQWAVSDEAAALFAEELHIELAKHGDPALAVAAARRRLQDELPHPWQWAAFRYLSARMPHPEDY